MKQIWRNYKWVFITIAGIVVFIMGFIGYEEHFAALGKSKSSPEILCFTMKLFKMNCDLSTKSEMLEAARWLAPLVAMFTAFLGFAVIFRNRISIFFARYAKAHVVICGLGAKGMQLVREFHKERVVVIEADETNEEIPSCLDMGATVLVGHATDALTLRKVGVSQAKYVLAVCGDDGINTEIAVQTQRLVNENTDDSTIVKCFIHIVDLKLCTLFKQHKIFTDTEDRFDARIFNIYENTARLLVKENPPDREHIAPSAPRTVHLIVAGFGQMGESVVLQAAKIGHYANMKKLRITVIDRKAMERQRTFQCHYPKFGEICDYQFIESEIEDSGLLEKMREWAQDQNLLTTVAVCFDSDTRSLSCALTLNAGLKFRRIPILVRMRDEIGLVTLLRGNDDGTGKAAQIRPFGIISNTCSREIVLDEQLDRLAEKIHENYVKECIAQGMTMESKPALRPWNKLNQFFRDANRQQADHIYVKIRAIGAEVCSEEEKTGMEPFEFTDEEVDFLARTEHVRWYASYSLEGYTYGPKRDDDMKTHPYLVPWEEISEDIREYDREAVRNIPKYLGMIGEKIRR
ncbi:NAD-binding protein [Desulfobacterales bacterium HSG2]|nr:NAD-binding protein [Desulfobacterales bacterium HSG2]